MNDLSDKLETECEERVRGIKERKAALETPELQLDLAQALIKIAGEILEYCDPFNAGDLSDLCIEEISTPHGNDIYRGNPFNVAHIRFGHFEDLQLDQYGWSIRTDVPRWAVGNEVLAGIHSEFVQRFKSMGSTYVCPVSGRLYLVGARPGTRSPYVESRDH